VWHPFHLELVAEIEREGDVFPDQLVEDDAVVDALDRDLPAVLPPEEAPPSFSRVTGSTASTPRSFSVAAKSTHVFCSRCQIHEDDVLGLPFSQNDAPEEVDERRPGKAAEVRAPCPARRPGMSRRASLHASDWNTSNAESEESPAAR
jgi:hypothetical protein